MPVLISQGPRASALAAALRNLMVEGRLKAGEKLPPSRIFAEQLNLSRGVVVAAYEQLVSEGFAYSMIGAGTFVAEVLVNSGSPAINTDETVFDTSIKPGQLGLGMADHKSLSQLRKLLNQSLARHNAFKTGYPDPRGSESLRIEIANYLRVARAARVHHDQIVITSGAQQAIDLIFRAILKKGDQIWIEDPCYQMAAHSISSHELVPIPISVTSEGLDVPEALKRAPKAKAAYVTPSHQFPLGVTLSMAQRIRMIDWAAANRAWIIEDDYDSEFRYSGSPLASLQGIDRNERVIYVGSFSKSLIPGIRCGYAIIPKPLMSHLIEVRKVVDKSPVNLIDEALAAFIREGYFARHLKRARNRAKLSRDSLVGGLRKKGINVKCPDQGLHLVVDCNSSKSEKELVNRLKTAGLQSYPLSSFYLAPTRRRYGVVIGFSGYGPEVFAAILKKL